MSHHCASHPRVPCHNSYTYQGQAFGLPHHIEDDATSDYPDSLPDLVTDSGAPYPSPQTSSALTTRGPLDLYRPGTCYINHAPNVVDRLLGGDSLVLTLYQRSMGAAAFRPPPPSDDDLVPTVVLLNR
ncbi:hypothetical protein B0H19DRAFT_1275732 [Mycena capillaripes]|nr:hypothetical protein B0H19DRAFT_1275732 [Mycena capillaripes]